MEKIKNIYCLGTSFTAGGGFEWEGSKFKLLEKLYGNVDEERTEYNYSWPGQLQKLLKQKNYKIKVHNEAQSGYGLDTLFRKVSNIVNTRTFSNKTDLFFLEFSDFGRLEYYSKQINDYIVANYFTDKKNNVNDVHLANSYFYDSEEIIKTLDKIQPKILSFLEETLDEQTEVERLSRQTSFFLSWIKLNEINVIFSSPPQLYLIKDWDFVQSFDFMYYYEEKYLKNPPQIIDYIINNDLSISTETNNEYQDGHAGLGGNKIISKVAFNNLIKLGYIKDDLIDIKSELQKYHSNLKNYKKLL